MITPRRITLHRVPDLVRFRDLLSAWLLDLPPDVSRDTAVVLPTRAAAEQLRRTVEVRLNARGPAAVLWPVLVTRGELRAELAARLPQRPRTLSAFEREVILSSVARELADEGLAPPFELRPGLVAEMLSLYDHVRRLGRSIDDFERNFRTELEREQDTDRGAAQLLQQTLFLAAAYRAYESRLADAGRLDEHALTSLLLATVPARPLDRLVVTVADRVADADGLWPADFDLLSRLPGLRQVDLVATEHLLASGYIERLYAAFPDLDERRAGTSSPPPTLVAPASPEPVVCFSHRDREEELSAVARRVKRAHREGHAPPLHRTGIIVRRPLPYLYLARDVFQDAGVPFETLDTLPLAAEPYAAAVDLVLDAVAAGYTRTSLLALLRSPHFRLGGPEAEEAAAVSACDFALADARYLGGLDRLEALVARWSTIAAPASRDERRQITALPAARAVLHAVRDLQTLAGQRPLVAHIGTLVNWLRRYDRPGPAGDPTQSRRSRVRAAVLGALTALSRAYAEYDPHAEGDVTTLSASLRRWLGAQTFAAPTGEPGLQILDAQAARYADMDDLQIVGLVEGEWPERVRRNVLYPPSLLALLEPLPAIADPTRRERDALQASRAAFRDLLLSARQRVRVSSFALEHDAVVEPSVLADDIPSFGLPAAVEEPDAARVTLSEALMLAPRRGDVLPAPMAAWAAVRLGQDAREPAQLRGEAGVWTLPRVSVSRLELYLNCPFKFFAAQVLKLEERPEDEDVQTPLERGRWLHDLWERFFAEWQRRGHGRIGPEQVAEARALFSEMCEDALSRLPPAEAVLERQRLLGSALGPGIAHRVFTMEASRPARIAERLLEFALEGEFEFRARDGRTRRVPLNAKTDRIDVLEGRALRVIDYKSKHTPDVKLALQLPIYAHLARRILEASRGGAWTLAEALYISFEGDRAVVPLKVAKGQTLDDVVADAEDRLLQALEDIAAGHFPPRPAKKSLCHSCSFSSVCRLDIVEVPAEETQPEAAAEVHGD